MKLQREKFAGGDAGSKIELEELLSEKTRDKSSLWIEGNDVSGAEASEARESRLQQRSARELGQRASESPDSRQARLDRRSARELFVYFSIWLLHYLMLSPCSTLYVILYRKKEHDHQNTGNTY